MSYRIKSIAVILYLIYIFGTGIPQPWRPAFVRKIPPIRFVFNNEMFPWGVWGMFIREMSFGQEFIAEGTTATGENLTVPMKNFFPPSNHWILEGNRVTRGVRTFLKDSKFAFTFCSWMVQMYNSSISQNSDRVQTLHLIVIRHPFPNTIPPPKLRIEITSCRAAGK